MNAANTTRDTLKSSNDVDDLGSVSTLAARLYDYVSGSEVDINATVARFFDQLFAAVYLHGDGAPAGVQPATVDCVASVRRHRDGAWVPFGGVAGTVGDELTRSLRVARVLVNSLRVAGEVAQSLVSVDFSHQCSRALTRLRYCAACEGFVNPVLPPPCRHFCSNVARGCLVHLAVGEVGRQWERFIDANNQLASFGVKGRNDLESVVADLPTLLSNEVTLLQRDIQKYHAEVGLNTCLKRHGNSSLDLNYAS